MLSYPPDKTETGRQMFAPQGADVFNKQTKYIREENLYCVLKTEIDLYDGNTLESQKENEKKPNHLAMLPIIMVILLIFYKPRQCVYHISKLLFR